MAETVTVEDAPGIEGEPRLSRWEGWTQWPLAVLAAVFLVVFSVEVLAPLKPAEKEALEIVLKVVWGLFVVDFLVRLTLATNRLNWFFRHFFDFVVAVLPILRPLGLLRLLVMLGALYKAVGGAIRGRVVSYAVFGVLLLIYGASLAILDTERNVKDSQITTFGDALWWSVTTVTTVGYGDMAPLTLTGRLIAVVLMVGGISLVGVVTATVASWIIERVKEESADKQAVTSAEIDALRGDMQARVDSLSAQLERMTAAVETLTSAGRNPAQLSLAELEPLSAELDRISSLAGSLERV